MVIAWEGQHQEKQKLGAERAVRPPLPEGRAGSGKGPSTPPHVTDPLSLSAMAMWPCDKNLKS